MPVVSVDISRFLKMTGEHPVIDVRSPAEFNHAHIPMAYNVPLFSDEERAVVGTLYKQDGRQSAVLKGLEFFGPRMKAIIDKAESIVKTLGKQTGSDPRRIVLVHCWRGGMRSAGVAWLLDLYGFTVYTLSGGYKAFRSWVLDVFETKLPLNVLGGYTGSGKTRILASLKRMGRPVIDLEALASHKGSSFGALGMDEQPSQEMFENLLAFEIHDKSNFHKEESPETKVSGTVGLSRVWIEDESQRIGRVNIPKSFWNHMRTQPVIFVELPFDIRLKTICEEYGSFERDQIVAGITRIRKRLGGLETKTAIGRLIEEDVKGSFEVLLRYYDKTYEKSLANREDADTLIGRLKVEGSDPGIISQRILMYEANHQTDV